MSIEQSHNYSDSCEEDIDHAEHCFVFEFVHNEAVLSIVPKRRAGVVDAGPELLSDHGAGHGLVRELERDYFLQDLLNEALSDFLDLQRVVFLVA